jgi:dGTP triphosphohydrolase
MTFEESLSTLALNTGRIATALESLIESQGIVNELNAPDLVEKAEKNIKKAAKKKKKVAAKKVEEEEVEELKQEAKAPTKTVKVVGKQTDSDADTEYTIKDVRDSLKDLQAKTNQGVVKSLLKSYGASTLPQLTSANYSRVIADVREQLADE